MTWSSSSPNDEAPHPADRIKEASLFVLTRSLLQRGLLGEAEDVLEEMQRVDPEAASLPFLRGLWAKLAALRTGRAQLRSYGWAVFHQDEVRWLQARGVGSAPSRNVSSSTRTR